MAIPYSFDILQAVIEATPDAIFVKDLEGRYIVVNAAAARFLGRAPDDIIGKHDLELYPEETARRFIADDQQVLASGRALSFEGTATSDTGTQAYLVTKGVYRDKAGRILGIFGISHDMTDLRQAEQALAETREALFRAQKLEAIGHLTGGLAHDFNNILSVILGNLDILRLQLPPNSPTRDLIDAVMRAAVHAQELTGNLLASTRRRRLKPQPHDVNALITHMVRLIARTLPPRVKLTTALQEHPCMALVDATALEAAILNVVLNSRDAMPHGGTVTLRTSCTSVAQRPDTDVDPEPGSYVVIEIEDTGIGMTAEVSERAFEPLFTTKADEGGTGLGLSMVREFARESGGAVLLSSRVEQGTIVKILLPLVATDVSQ